MLLKRFLVLFVLLALLSGCDNPVLDVFREPMPEVQDIPEHVWEDLAFYRENVLRGLDRQYEREPTEENLELLDARRAFREVEKVRERAFYKKYIDAGGIAIIGDVDVGDEHFIHARNAILVMTSKHPELLDTSNDPDWTLYPELGNAVPPNYIMILTWKHWQLPHRFVAYYDHDNPEHHENPFWMGHALVCPPDDACYYARDHAPTCHFGFCEGWINVPLSSDGDPLPESAVYPFLDTFIHEFTHKIHGMFEVVDPTFRSRLNEVWKRANELDKFPTRYARRNVWEYWAETVKVWFYHVGEGREKYRNVLFDDYDPTEFDDYEALREFDPLLYDLLDYWFPKVQLPWHY